MTRRRSEPNKIYTTVIKPHPLNSITSRRARLPEVRQTLTPHPRLEDFHALQTSTNTSFYTTVRPPLLSGPERKFPENSKSYSYVDGDVADLLS